MPTTTPEPTPDGLPPTPGPDAAPSSPAPMPPEPPAPGRLRVARAVVARRRLRAALRLQPARARRVHLAAGVQAGLGAALALGLTHLSPWPHLAGFTALGAMATLYGRFDPLRPRLRVVTVVAGLLVGAMAVTSLAVLLTTGLVVPLLVVGVVAGFSTSVTVARGIGAPGATIVVFAAGACLGPVESLADVGARTVAGAGGAALAFAIVVGLDRLRPRVLVPPAVARAVGSGPEAPRGRETLAAGVRVLVGASVAGLAVHALGGHHPAWGAIGAAAVLQGAHLQIHVDRALQRALGTTVGALVAAGIFWLDLSFWPTVATVAVLQVVTEVTIGRSYAIGQMTVTPMALLVSELAAPTGGATLPLERVVDTVLGVVLGVVAALVLSDRASRSAAHG